jgi:hypothetical protein
LATNETSKPILFVDVDGVISVFGFTESETPPGRFQWVDGIAHCIVPDCGERLNRLAERFELVWATGWEERANEHLPFLLDLDADELPWLSFEGRAVFGTAHWKLDAIGEYAGDRPAAWIDDSIDEECEAWAHARTIATLLVRTESPVGMTDGHVEELLKWAEEVAAERDAAA